MRTAAYERRLNRHRSALREHFANGGRPETAPRLNRTGN